MIRNRHNLIDNPVDESKNTLNTFTINRSLLNFGYNFSLIYNF